ncbi:MAG: hypothetical protein L3J03_07965 [Desulfobacterales bacterium]|nr:hypothetical protein [Desulfobacterales bacterium]
MIWRADNLFLPGIIFYSRSTRGGKNAVAPRQRFAESLARLSSLTVSPGLGQQARPEPR